MTLKKATKMKFSKILIIVLLTAIAVFFVAMMITYWCMGDVPEPLINGFTTVVTSELLSLMLIKRSDNRYSQDETSEPQDEAEDDNIKG